MDLDIVSNWQRFINAFSGIEDILSDQQGRRRGPTDWPTFVQLLDDSDTLLHRDKQTLRQHAKLRNAISHGDYKNNKPLADPRIDVVEEIESIHRNLLKPPLLTEVLSGHAAPIILETDDSLRAFLDVVSEHDYSQTPVRVESGHKLITTNAVARWFAYNFERDGGVIELVKISEVLSFAETGDQLKSVNPQTTVVQAINMLTGEASPDVEPPAALLVLGKMGQGPQRLCSRADLSRLYARLSRGH